MFHDSMSAEQLDLGQGMVIHPVTGIRMTRLHYVPDRRQFVLYKTTGAWDWDPDMEFQPRISAGKYCLEGCPFPSHWVYDPFTGKSLRAHDLDVVFVALSWR